MNTDSPNSFKFYGSELKILRELDSFDFGFIKFNSSKGQLKKQLLEKAISCLDNSLSKIVQQFREKKEQDESELNNGGCLTPEKQLQFYEKYIRLLNEDVDSNVYLYLGHFQLLLYLYEDALSAYLEFEGRNTCSWKNISFLYGLAICYFHFNAFDKAIELFQKVLYLRPDCQKSKEIHIRLGYIYKINANFDCSLRHFRQALNDSTKGSFTETEIRFQIAHLLEVCGKYKQAQKAYEQLISFSKEEVPDHIKHLCYRQLGWLHFAGFIGKSNPNTPKKNSVINLLHQAIQLDDSSGKTWYLLGRAQARENKVQEAFMAYRNSIDKTEANADTWCSIGVLYQEQNQQMDALQAYFCACQLDRKHVAAWTNLGVLYESMCQYKEALKCYQNAINSDKNNEVRAEIKDRLVIIQKLLAQFPEKTLTGGTSGSSSHQQSSIINQQHKLANSGGAIRPQNNHPSSAAMTTVSGTPTGGSSISPSMMMKLPTVDEAWNLPIPTELTQRRMQLEMQEAVASASSSSGGASRLFAHHLPSYLSSSTNNTNTTATTTQSSSSSSVSIDNVVGVCTDGNAAKRRRASGNVDDPILPLTVQQQQLLMSLESQNGQLTAQQRQNLTMLQNQLHRYQMHHQQQQSNKTTAQSSSTSDTLYTTTTNVDKKDVKNIISTNTNQGHNIGTDNAGTQPEDLIHELDEIPEDYGDDIMVNIDALLNDPMNNFDDHFDENNQGGVSCNSNQMDTDKYIKEEPEEPVADLLSYLRSFVNDKCLISNPLDEFCIAMTGSQIIDKVNRTNTQFMEKLSSSNNVSATAVSTTHNNLWNITYLPGNRIPQPPFPPPIVTPNRQSSCANSHNGNVNASRQNAEYFQLLPPTPSVYLDCKKDIHSPELRQFCLSQPVVVIRNLASTLRMDLGVFSTKALVEANPTHKIEQRIQDIQPSDENKDPTGKTVLRCFSSKSTTTIQEYANYQARSFVEAKKDEKTCANNGSTTSGCTGTAGGGQTGSVSNGQSDEPKPSGSGVIDDKKKRRKIFFGTNCDLSDESKWFVQLHELNKLPNFLKVVSACNMLSHCGFTIMGMNSVQLYMKVPGCRTPGHQENNNFCSVNINVGPGDCEWFSSPEQYWGAIYMLCEENKVDYLSGSWWPSLDDLKQRQIPVYRFIQRPGDLVWINAGTVHWVQAIGWCNNVAWNVGPLISRQYSLAMDRYEFNKLKMYKSIVPMVHLSWQLARNIKMTDSHLYQLIKHTLMVSLIQCTLIWDFLEKARVTMVLQTREDNEHTQHCADCECEVFNIFLIKQMKTSSVSKRPSKEVRYETRCLNCALKMNSNISSFKAIYQYKLSELVEIYDSFKFQSTPIAAYSVNR